MIRVCEHCWTEITDEWISDMPKPGAGWQSVPYWHMKIKECQRAGFASMSESQRRDG